MAVPGEINHIIGQTYQHVFIAALQSNMKRFEHTFTVQREPEKMSFHGRDGSAFSFDFRGRYSDYFRYNEVFCESKGYSTGSGLLPEFRVFLAKAYVTSFDHSWHRKDLFWFVTNVPFACSEGSRLRSVEFIKKTLTDPDDSNVRRIIGAGDIDDNFVRDLAERIGVFIFTDSYLRATELSYRVEPGENLWVILKKLHAGRIPKGFGAISNQIASRNHLTSPDKIISGKKLVVPWLGITPA